MTELQTFKATGDMVIVPREEYDALISRLENEEDERDFSEAIAEINAGAELLDGDFVGRLLETDCPLREWRIYRGLSQTKLAEAAGVRQATISAIEKGSVPRINNARRIADALDCDLDDLF